MSTRPGLARGGGRVGSTRRALLERDGNSCRRCGDPIDMDRSGLDPLGPSIGHIIPAAQGGTDALANLGLEHRRCNLAAGARRDPPRALIATPIARVAIAALIAVGLVTPGASAASTYTSSEQTYRDRLLACTLVEEARSLELDPRIAIPSTTSTCAALIRSIRFRR